MKRLQELGAVEQATALQTIVGTWALDQRRKIDQRAGTLADIIRLKRAARLADGLLDSTAEGHWEQMRGWRFQQLPENAIQCFFSQLHTFALQLGFAIAALEDQFPEYRPLFEQERLERTGELQQQQARATP